MAGQITALVVQQKNKKRVNVYLDGEFAFGLAMIEALKLQRGQMLSDEDIDRLKTLDAIETAQERALNFLSYRPRSKAEVEKRLQEKGFAEPAIETVLDRLERAGLINDEEFARFWVQNRLQFKPRAGRLLQNELAQKGISDLVSRAIISEIDEEVTAYRAAKRKADRIPKSDYLTFRKKLGDFLLRRGFSYRVIRTVTEQIWKDSENTDALPEDLDSTHPDD